MTFAASGSGMDDDLPTLDTMLACQLGPLRPQTGPVVGTPCPERITSVRFKTMVSGKIHRARVTAADLHYVGSITVDLDLVMQKAKSTGMSTSKLDEVKDKVAGIKGQVLAEVLGVTL